MQNFSCQNSARVKKSRPNCAPHVEAGRKQNDNKNQNPMSTKLKAKDPAATEPLPGFREIKPSVFAGLYPVESHQYAELRESLEKLRLVDYKVRVVNSTASTAASMDENRAITSASRPLASMSPTLRPAGARM